MMHKIILYLFFASALFGQFNHQDKLVIKRKLRQSTVTVDFDGRTNETGFFHKHLDIGIHYSFKPTWKVGLKYRAQYRTKENEWHLEQRPQGELIKGVNSQKLKWEFRTRMDYRIREGKNDEMRNRSRIQLKALNPISLLKITPLLVMNSFSPLNPGTIISIGLLLVLTCQKLKLENRLFFINMFNH